MRTASIFGVEPVISRAVAFPFSTVNRIRTEEAPVGWNSCSPWWKRVLGK